MMRWNNMEMKSEMMKGRVRWIDEKWNEEMKGVQKCVKPNLQRTKSSGWGTWGWGDGGSQNQSCSEWPETHFAFWSDKQLRCWEIARLKMYFCHFKVASTLAETEKDTDTGKLPQNQCEFVLVFALCSMNTSTQFYIPIFLFKILISFGVRQYEYTTSHFSTCSVVHSNFFNSRLVIVWSTMNWKRGTQVGTSVFQDSLYFPGPLIKLKHSMIFSRTGNPFLTFPEDVLLI